MGNEQSVPPGLRERTKEATRAGLQAAAVRLVLAHGVSAVTVEDIAASANVSARTFFNYFASKEEALLGRTVGVCQSAVQALRERPGEESPLGAVRALLPSLVDAVGSDRATWRDRAEVVRANPQLLPHLLQCFVDEERAGRCRRGAHRAAGRPRVPGPGGGARDGRLPGHRGPVGAAGAHGLAARRPRPRAREPGRRAAGAASGRSVTTAPTLRWASARPVLHRLLRETLLVVGPPPAPPRPERCGPERSALSGQLLRARPVMRCCTCTSWLGATP
ncbi:TetR/AcrR family transcriptional regulator [Rhodococcus sp. X156]|uniref:TetR/AcrR family transcriptional regulator n=1 Tax=Rhodococcus sp. X156 TaxID=2499145 RepID=UPI000FD78A02|nr:TetR/AcrR family transcriptional regulator [Rhodococcus sp. X156]